MHCLDVYKYQIASWFIRQ